MTDCRFCHACIPHELAYLYSGELTNGHFRALCDAHRQAVVDGLLDWRSAMVQELERVQLALKESDVNAEP